ncbi:hypothetical protein F4604DRAFT_1592410, partial [Suillus subluteus]
RMERLLYQKVVLSDEITASRFLSAMRLRSPNRSEGAVQSLCVEGDVLPSTAADILSLCRSTHNLALWITPSDLAGKSNPLLRPLHVLPLKSLSLSISHIFNHTPLISLPTIPVFSTLTHLEILNDWVMWSSTVGLEHLQQLTHLCLRLHTKRTKPALVMSLFRNLSLRVLVFCASEDFKTVQSFLECTGLIDPCIVLANYALVDLNDFRNGDITSLWQKAEQITQQRRAIKQGKFESNFTAPFRQSLIHRAHNDTSLSLPHSFSAAPHSC